MDGSKRFARVAAGFAIACMLGIILALAAGCGDESTNTATSADTTDKTQAATAKTSATTGTSTSGEGGNEFKAKLSGQEVVPPVTTQATGEAEFNLSADGKSMTYELKVSSTNNINAAHIHIAAAGANGPVAVLLFGGSKPGVFSGTLSEGTITAADLSGPLAGMSISDLVDYIKMGQAYVNVHTSEYSNGIIRGQIKQT